MSAFRILPATLIVVMPLLTSLPGSATAGFGDWLKGAMEKVEPALGDKGSGAALLSNDDIISGLKQALQQGVGQAVSLLGKSDGFLANPKVRIPVPDSIKPVADTLRRFGQSGVVDEFEQTLNRAAEAAVPEGRQILVDAVSGMSIADAKNILNGPQDAATQYFRKASGQRLHEKVLPIIRASTRKTGVTSAYKNLAGQAGPVAGMLGMEVPDLDSYVADKALDGLFLMIAEEEARIRANPAARGTELLKRVFGN